MPIILRAGTVLREIGRCRTLGPARNYTIAPAEVCPALDLTAVRANADNLKPRRLSKRAVATPNFMLGAAVLARDVGTVVSEPYVKHL